MNILVACEESQRVCLAFRKLGHNAFSCDILPCSGGFPQFHILGDVLPLLNGFCSFYTMDGAFHSLDSRWDLIIAHPPCTFLSAAGACRMYPKKGVIDSNRFASAMAAKQFFMDIWNCNCDKVVIENPRPLKCVGLIPESQRIQPYYFGEPFSKLTYLWVRGLPLLQPTNILSNFEPWIDSCTSYYKGTNHNFSASRRRKERSKTFFGVAAAMASQWG